MVQWKPQPGIVFLFPMMKKFVPGLKVPPMTYGQYSRMHRLARKFAHTPLWVDILDGLYWETLPQKLKDEAEEDHKKNGSVTALHKPPDGPFMDISPK